ncbi:MAG: AIPR family protein [Nitrospira sp.]
MPISEAQKTQIIEVLKQRYFPIVLPIQQNWSPEQHEKNRLSRSLSVFAIEKLAEVDPTSAANALMDGGNDNGLDAVCYDRAKNTLWLIQAKAGNAPDMGENKKFCDGITDLIEGRFEKFNETFERLESDVEEALSTTGVKIIGCHIHLGGELGTHAITDLEQLKVQLNRFDERFDWKECDIPIIHGWLTAEHAIAPVSAELTLEKWYGVDQPRRAFYGLVCAEELATLYQQHGKALFEKNIRHYLGAQTVNTAIETTVQDRPNELFYLNNGLTAVCSSIQLKPGANNEKRRFSLEGFSVVNGAQTVGSIATVRATKGAISPDAKLLITLIEVGNAPDNLGPQITRSRNTQNSIRGLHFAALDPLQERLRQDLAISGVTYYYRPSAEAAKKGPNVITLEEAAVSLASLSGKTKTIVAAKKEIGQIYDQTGVYYKGLFRDDLTGVRLCRAVRIYRHLMCIFLASELAEMPHSRRKMFYRHGAFFILHILARRHRSLVDKPQMDLAEDDQAELSRVGLEIAELIYTVAEEKFQQLVGYLSIFRNITDAEMLASEVMQRLAKQDAHRQSQAQFVGQTASPPSETSSGANSA